MFRLFANIKFRKKTYPPNRLKKFSHRSWLRSKENKEKRKKKKKKKKKEKEEKRNTWKENSHTVVVYRR
jgi:hypothetical protein